MCRNAVLVALLGLIACAASAKQPPSLDWLEGCWRSADGTMTEHWTRGGPALWFGFGTVVADGKVVFFEQLRIDASGEHASLYAYPAGEGPTRFRLAAAGKTSATFVNPAHDFPQRIHYARADGSLEATISLLDGTRERRFIYRPCAPERNASAGPRSE